ncbi:MAG: acyl-CoA dehydrogenase family protein [Acidimicrobiales bacterium]
MHLTFTEDQLALQATARAVLDRECPPSLVREAVEKGTGSDRLWRCLAGLGWPALTVPEAAGGLGQGFVELAVVLEELGRACAPGPYLATMTQFLPALRAAGDRDGATAPRWLSAVARGELTGTLALAEGPTWEPRAVRATAQPVAGGWLLHGTKRHVLSGAEVDELVVAVRPAGDGGLALVVVPARDLAIEPVESLDATRPLATVRLDGVLVPDDRVLAPAAAGADVALARVLHEATVGLALDTVGACQTLLDTTLAYAKVREQFGVPIGSFQAVKHRFADMLVALEKARVTAYFAALTVAEDDPRRAVAASMAKAAAGDCQRLLTSSAIQLHGGVGFTWEHDAHLWVKRAKTGELLFGTSEFHRRIVADHAFSSATGPPPRS